MNLSKLTFQQNKFTRNNIRSSDYIEFFINEVPLSEIVGGLGEYEVGKFGRSYNQEYQLNCVEELKTGISKLENGLISIYVCSECGDEGCGAVMFELIKHDKVIEWTNFVNGNGDLPRGEDVKIDVSPIYFDKFEYYKSLYKLKIMINKKF